MHSFYLVFYLILFSFSTHAPAWTQESDLKPDVTVMIPMRDGTSLPTDLYFPSPDAKNLPCILLRSPAGRKASPWVEFARMAKAGYVIAIQDARNFLDEQGKTFPFLSDGWGKRQDGYDTVQWLSKSPYTNGNIGTWGSSALGITQLLMAPSKPPNLKCQYILVAAASIYHHVIFPGGQMSKNQTEGWLGRYAPDAGVLNYVSQRPLYSNFWQQFDTVKVANQVQVPAIFIGGWYDTFLQGTLAAFASRQYSGGEGALGQQKLVIGPWTHMWPLSKQFGDFQVPEAGVSPPFDISPKRWFDHYLKGEDNHVEELPSVIYYVMGPFDGEPSSGNVWRTSDTWPVPSVKTTFYLTPDFGLQEENAFTGVLSFEYDPFDVIPTLGGSNLFLESGPKDQSKIEDRSDILVFTSAPLAEDLEVTGEVSADIFFTSNQMDTDIVLRLSDVYPDGRSILIGDGVYRLGVKQYPDQDAYINKMEHLLYDHYHNLVKLEADKPIALNIDLSSTSIVFAKGHSIRLSISSSNYPRYEKNLNVGLFNSHNGLFNLAVNVVHMGGIYPSHLILPVVRKGNVLKIAPKVS